MSNDAARYQVVVEGELDQRFEHLFQCMTICRSSGQTEIVGDVADQAALQGLLDRVADLGLVLLSVNRVGSEHR